LTPGTEWVPADVPSLTHRSVSVPSKAVNATPPSNGVISPMNEPALAPVLMSLTRWVPAAVPSLVHSSLPVPSPASAMKYRLPPDATTSEMFEPEEPGRMSSTNLVPAAVPSLTHSSAPCVPSLAVK
jgi:hypothetical protein